MAAVLIKKWPPSDGGGGLASAGRALQQVHRREGSDGCRRPHRAELRRVELLPQHLCRKWCPPSSVILAEMPCTTVISPHRVELISHWSLIISHKSLVMSHWSLVISPHRVELPAPKRFRGAAAAAAGGRSRRGRRGRGAARAPARQQDLAVLRQPAVAPDLMQRLSGRVRRLKSARRPMPTSPRDYVHLAERLCPPRRRTAAQRSLVVSEQMR